MHIEVCDACGEWIKERGDRVAVARGVRLSEFVFCVKCAEPILKFLEGTAMKTENRA